MEYILPGGIQLTDNVEVAALILSSNRPMLADVWHRGLMVRR